MAFVISTFTGTSVRIPGVTNPPAPCLGPNSRTAPRRSRMALATKPKNDDPGGALYIGVAPERRRGRLRVDFSERFREPEEDFAAATALSEAAELENYQWSSGGYNQLTRSFAVWLFILRLLSTNWLDQRAWTYPLGRKTDERRSRRLRRLAVWARCRILQLGPTFIKLGQLASTRADILPKEVTEELRVLQDQVPPFNWRAAEAILEKEYGKPVGEVFRYFEKIPLAAASLGQVHRATLFSGEEIVVKIQRPGLKKLFDLDLEAMRGVAEFLQRSKKYGGNGRDWVGIYEECKRVLYEEIDYVREAESCTRFRNNFLNANIDYVKVPRAFPEYSTRTVLCLQYLPGIRISDKAMLQKAGLDLSLIAQRVATAFLMQVLEFSFFTCDPHPGNAAVGVNESIIFYDFGMVASLNPNIKDRLVDILAGVIDKDAEVVMNALVDLDALVLPPDPLPVRRSIQFFLDSVGSRPTREQTVAAIGDDLYATAYDRPFRLPAQSIFLLRALSTLEGLNKSLDPDFQFSSVALPFADDLLGARKGDLTPSGMLRSVAASIVTGRPNPVADELRKQAIGAGAGALKASARIERIDKTLSQLERGDLKLRARSTETERLLRKQFLLTESSNFLVSTGATALAATQLYETGNLELAAAMAVVSAALGFTFLRKTSKINKDIFKSDEGKDL